MQIQLDKSWLGHPVGRILDLGGGQAELLIRRKFAHEYKAEGKAGGKPEGKPEAKAETKGPVMPKADEPAPESGPPSRSQRNAQTRLAQ